MALTPRVHEEGRSRLVAYDHGAHLASWELEKEPVVWLSPAAVLDGSTAIRGGVPICFPWFADGPDGEHSPGHGVVRTATWSPAPARDDEVWAWELQDTGVADARGAHQIPGPFHLRYAVRLSPGAPEGSPALDLHLELHNPGSTAYTVEVALHTYLAVGDVERIRIEGLDGAHYLDKVTGRDEHQAGALGLTGETDRVYDRSGPVQVHDPVHARVLELAPPGRDPDRRLEPVGQEVCGRGRPRRRLLARFRLRGECGERSAPADHGARPDPHPGVLAGGADCQTRVKACDPTREKTSA